MNGFVHTAEGFAKYCAASSNTCSGNFTDLVGKRAMGYYDQDFLNYYYYMASQLRDLGSLVLAGGEQERSESSGDLYRRHDAGPGTRPGKQ